MATKLEWDKDSERLYETGASEGILFPMTNAGTYEAGVPWNGLTAVNENPTGADVTKLYANDGEYLNLMAKERYGATIEAYMSPVEFDECDGAANLAKGVRIRQQKRRKFGFAYKTKIGNDIEGDEYGATYHLIYNAQAKPTGKNHQTVNENPDAPTLSWEIETTPVKVAGMAPTSVLEVDTVDSDPTALKKFLAILQGAEEFDATKTYEVGDWVTHTVSEVTKTYECSTAISTPGVWDDEDWTEVPAATAGPRLPLPAEVKTIFAEIAG